MKQAEPDKISIKDQVLRDLILFLSSPREYLFSFTYPADKKVVIEPYNPRVKQTGYRIVKKIQKKFPELAIHFIGSAILGIAGQRDIDLFIECSYEKFNQYLPTLTALLGKKPDKIKRKFIEWHFEHEGCSIELLLVDPSSTIFRGPIQRFEIIRNDKKLIEEYRKIKDTSNGLSIREYQRRKLSFFNKIIKLS